MCMITGEGPEAYWKVWRKARKQHICCECASTIDPGEKYLIISGIWDGEFDSFKQCEFCAEAYDEQNRKIQEFGYYQGIGLGCLWETVGM